MAAAVPTTIPSAPPSTATPAATATAASVAVAVAESDDAGAFDPDDVKAVAYVTGGAGKLLLTLDSDAGQARLRDCEQAGTSHYAVLWPHFRKQRGNTACGLATSATLLQALYRHRSTAVTATATANSSASASSTSVAAAAAGASSSSSSSSAAVTVAAPARAFKELTILDGLSAEYAKTLNWTAVRNNGMTLADVALLMTAHGAAVTSHHAADLKDENGLRALLQSVFTAPASAPPATASTASAAAASASSSSASQSGSSGSSGRGHSGESFVALNWYLGAVGYGEFGHHSVCGAYDRASDSVLVLDVWRAFPHAWYPLPLLWRALHTVDPDSGRTRGVVVVALPRPADGPAAAAAAAAAGCK